MIFSSALLIKFVKINLKAYNIYAKIKRTLRVCCSNGRNTPEKLQKPTSPQVCIWSTCRCHIWCIELWSNLCIWQPRLCIFFPRIFSPLSLLCSFWAVGLRTSGLTCRSSPDDTNPELLDIYIALQTVAVFTDIAPHILSTDSSQIGVSYSVDLLAASSHAVVKLVIFL